MAPENDVLKLMLEIARAESKNAYAPYSNFPVGASIMCKSSLMASGCNVENASYGLTMCAERVAVYSMGPLDLREGIVAVVIYTPTTKPFAPCGACRQVIAEFGDQFTWIASYCDGPDSKIWTLGELLPEQFSLKEE